MAHFTVSKLANGWLVRGNLDTNGGFYLKDLSEIQDAIAKLEAEEIKQRKRWEEENPQFARSVL